MREEIIALRAEAELAMVKEQAKVEFADALLARLAVPEVVETEETDGAENTAENEFVNI